MAAMSTQCLFAAPPGLQNSSSERLRRGGAVKLSSSMFTSPTSLTSLSPPGATSSSRFSMRAASKKQAYICRDCGYIYSDRTPFENKPDSYFCPVCGAPKRRFRAYEPKVSKDANSEDVRKARKAELKRNEAIGKALPYALVVGIVALVGIYLYLNSNY